TLRTGNMTAAKHTFLRILGHVRDLAPVFARRTHVDQRFTTFTLRQRFIEECTDLLIEPFLWHRITCLRVFWNLARHRTAFRFPFVTTAVENFHFLMTKQPERP